MMQVHTRASGGQGTRRTTIRCNGGGSLHHHKHRVAHIVVFERFKCLRWLGASSGPRTVPASLVPSRRPDSGVSDAAITTGREKP
jgi:hypothetical protein